MGGHYDGCHDKNLLSLSKIMGIGQTSRVSFNKAPIRTDLLDCREWKPYFYQLITKILYGSQ